MAGAVVIPTLRPCQDDLIGAIIAEYAKGHRRVVARADTGFGKTIVFCAIAARAKQKGNQAVALLTQKVIFERSTAKQSF